MKLIFEYDYKNEPNDQNEDVSILIHALKEELGTAFECSARNYVKLCLHCAEAAKDASVILRIYIDSQPKSSLIEFQGEFVLLNHELFHDIDGTTYDLFASKDLEMPLTGIRVLYQ